MEYYVLGKHPYRQLSTNAMSYNECKKFIRSTWKKEAWCNYIVVRADNLSAYINWFEKLKWLVLKYLMHRDVQTWGG